MYLYEKISLIQAPPFLLSNLILVHFGVHSQTNKKKKPLKYGLNKPYFKGRLMDLRGIEPLSENLFRTVSPITVSILTFPLSGV